MCARENKKITLTKINTTPQQIRTHANWTIRPPPPTAALNFVSPRCRRGWHVHNLWKPPFPRHYVPASSRVHTVGKIAQLQQWTGKILNAVQKPCFSGRWYSVVGTSRKSFDRFQHGRIYMTVNDFNDTYSVWYFFSRRLEVAVYLFQSIARATSSFRFDKNFENGFVCVVKSS